MLSLEGKSPKGAKVFFSTGTKGLTEATVEPGGRREQKKEGRRRKWDIMKAEPQGFFHVCLNDSDSQFSYLVAT